VNKQYFGFLGVENLVHGPFTRVYALSGGQKWANVNPSKVFYFYFSTIG